MVADKFDFIKSFLLHYDYPEDAVAEIIHLEERLLAENDFGEKLENIVNSYFFPQAKDLNDSIAAVEKLAEEYGENVYTMNLIFLLNCLPTVYEKYKEKNIPEHIFYESFDDIRCKLLECIECKGVNGIFVPTWYNGFFKLTLMAHGRFQYDCLFRVPNEEGVQLKCGKFLKKGDPALIMHIPSSGVPLTDEVRYDSYKRAYNYYRDMFGDGPAVFACGSWLLYDRHREFLPDKLNIRRFMDDFEIISTHVSDDFHDAWRVFGKYADLPPAQLPRDTTLRRAYADWLAEGNKTGSSFGYFVFDGERILK